MDHTKFCPTCQKEKPRADFYSDRSRFDGLTWECKDCQKQRKCSKPKERCKQIGGVLWAKRTARFQRRPVLFARKPSPFGWEHLYALPSGEVESRFVSAY